LCHDRGVAKSKTFRTTPLSEEAGNGRAAGEEA
jgi:hypothetical protein